MNTSEKLYELDDFSSHYTMHLANLQSQRNEAYQRNDVSLGCKLTNELILQLIDFHQKVIGLRLESLTFSVFKTDDITTLALKFIPIKEQAQARKQNNCNFNDPSIQKTINEQLKQAEAIIEKISDLSTKHIFVLAKMTLDSPESESELYMNKLIICHGPKCNNTNQSMESILKRCSNCKEAFYCSPICQKNDWKGAHKLICKKPESK